MYQLSAWYEATDPPSSKFGTYIMLVLIFANERQLFYDWN